MTRIRLGLLFLACALLIEFVTMRSNAEGLVTPPEFLRIRLRHWRFCSDESWFFPRSALDGVWQHSSTVGVEGLLQRKGH
jgi:hypothetical protein